MRHAPRTTAAIAIPLLLALTSIQATPDLSGYPNSMAATGDSITKAFNTGSLPFSDAPGNSWSTGTRDFVQSHYARILASDPDVSGRNFNEAVSGARMAALAAQVQRVNERGVAYVTILIGGNDLCTATPAQMTSVPDFRSQFERAMAALSAGSPRARIYVVSIPNVYRLWAILKDDLIARTTWRMLDVCQSLLARPLSTETSDVARRRAVRQRNVDFNAQLAQVCAEYIHCRFDRNAVFSDPFQPTDVSTRDFFHPSLEGQRRLARLTWGATFDFTDQTPPVTTAATTGIDGGLIVSLTAIDGAGVAGIEYRLDLGPWQRYTAPFALVTGSNIRFRAVDVNGNIEATQSLTA
jgi:lysophospholipase L1-like esterase